MGTVLLQGNIYIFPLFLLPRSSIAFIAWGYDVGVNLLVIRHTALRYGVGEQTIWNRIPDYACAVSFILRSGESLLAGVTN